MDKMERSLKKYFAGLVTGEKENELVMACVRLIQALDRAKAYRGSMRHPDMIFHECIEKYIRGAKKYGAYNPETDRRDLVHEALQELVDAVNYLAMEELRRSMAAEVSPEVKL